MSRNSLSFSLQPLPRVDKREPLPPIFEEETKRIENEAERLRTQMRVEEELGKKRSGHDQEFSRIESTYASFKESRKAAEKVKQVKDSLKPFRPPTAPSSDLEKERKEITTLAKRNMFFAQLALFLVVLVGLSYVTLPRSTADMAALGLLTVGIALGFFLIR
jgi:hypothetical protein